MNTEWQARTPNERFGTMAGVPRWIGSEKQQVTWLVASAGSPPLRQAATTLHASKFAQTLFEKVCFFRVIFFHLV
jgi:hypothetical protein